VKLGFKRQVACHADLATRIVDRVTLRALGSRSDDVGAQGAHTLGMRSGIRALALLTFLLSSCVANTSSEST
jgi:hypothetical protein